jgi:hypothetical protein
MGIFGFRKTRFYAIDFPNQKGAPHGEAAAAEASPPGRVSAIQPDTRAETRRNFFIWIPRNSLKSPESAKEIQGNPSLGGGGQGAAHHSEYGWIVANDARRAPRAILGGIGVSLFIPL